MGQKSNVAAVKVAHHLLRIEEYALGMGHRSSATYAGTRDALIKSSVEECAEGMVQRSNYAAVKRKDAAVKDAQIKFSREECARGMEQRSNYAVVKDVQILLKKEECALSMGQVSNYAAVKVAQIKS